MIKDDNEIALSMLKISFLKKLPFYGSSKGMRYVFKKENIDGDDILRVYVYEDVFCFEKTPNEKIIHKDFEFSKNGINDGLKFLDSININYEK